MEHIDSKQCVRYSAWRSPLKIGGVPPLAGRGYDYYIRYSLNIILVSFKIGRGYDSFLSVSLKFVGESVFSPLHSRQTPEIAYIRTLSTQVGKGSDLKVETSEQKWVKLAFSSFVLLSE